VIEERGVCGEPLLPHQLLVEKRTVSVAVLGMPFGRYRAPHLVVGHAASLLVFAAAGATTADF
jgi:hypothetical protein